VTVQTPNDRALPDSLVGTLLPGLDWGLAMVMDYVPAPADYRWVPTGSFTPGDVITLTLQAPAQWVPFLTPVRMFWTVDIGKGLDEPPVKGQPVMRTPLGQQVVSVLYVPPQRSPVAPG